MNETLARRIEEMATEATRRYNERFDNEVYRRATEGKPPDFCNLLIDQAMCLCGHPNYTIMRINWSPARLAFLELFA